MYNNEWGDSYSERFLRKFKMINETTKSRERREEWVRMFNTTYVALKQTKGSDVMTTRTALSVGNLELAELCRSTYKMRLQNVLSYELPEERGFTYGVIREFLELGGEEGDWNTLKLPDDIIRKFESLGGISSIFE